MTLPAFFTVQLSSSQAHMAPRSSGAPSRASSSSRVCPWVPSASMDSVRYRDTGDSSRFSVPPACSRSSRMLKSAAAARNPSLKGWAADAAGVTSRSRFSAWTDRRGRASSTPAVTPQAATAAATAIHHRRRLDGRMGSFISAPPIYWPTPKYLADMQHFPPSGTLYIHTPCRLAAPLLYIVGLSP